MGSTGEASDIKSANPEERTRLRACNSGRDNDLLDEVGSLASEFRLHPLAVEDAIHAHQRPKIERYDDTLFVVLRPARYLDDTEEVEFGEVHVFVGPRFVLTVRHSEAP